jgi:hypothetical protein
VGWGISLSRELCCFIPVVLWKYLIPLICSPFGPLDVSQAGFEPVSGGMEALLFSHLMWCGEALNGLGVQGVEFLFSLVLFFCHVWLQHLSKIFDLWHSCFQLLYCSHDLGFSEPSFLASVNKM